MINPVVNPEIEITTIKTIHKNIFNHHIEITHNIQTNRIKTTKKHQRQTKQVLSTDETVSNRTGIDNTETLELQLNHIPCESKDNEIVTENILIINKLEVEHE